MNIYKTILEANLPKLLHLYNLDPLSDTYGYGDRLHAGWKVIDFANGTFQGGVHALAIALHLNLLQNESFVLNLIDAIIRATAKIKHKNGSVIEAYPNEHSFCVTALVAFDTLSAIYILDKKLIPTQKQAYLDIIAPLIQFITQQNEEHAIISNHLATGVAAITLWNHLTAAQNTRGRELLNIIYQHQSSEGWYREYEGADPGYQSLCTYYLVAANHILQDARLQESIEQSLTFLQYAIHPDGSIGGLYGSRNTEVYYPGGLVYLATTHPICQKIVVQYQKGLTNGVHVRPQDIDIGNYIPLLNAYAFAAYYWEKHQMDDPSVTIATDRLPDLPHQSSFSKQFKDAGWYIQSTPNYYAIINYKKGGTIKVFDQQTQLLVIEDGGLVGQLKKGTKFSTQVVQAEQSFNHQQITSSFYAINESYPSPFQFIVLRSLGLSIFRSVYLGNWFKKVIVHLLMTGKTEVGGQVVRQFKFTPTQISVQETITPPKYYTYIQHIGKFKAIHMASSGYNTSHCYRKTDHPKFVEFKTFIK